MLIITFIFRCVCPALTDRKKRISKSYRTCRSNTTQPACCIDNADLTNSPLTGDALGDEQRYLGRRGLDELCTGTGSNINSRARPLFIPSDERSRHHNESNHESYGQQQHQHQQQPFVQIQQPKRQQRRPTELFLPTKQFENGHADPKPQASSYMEQFWICAKRFVNDVMIWVVHELRT